MCETLEESLDPEDRANMAANAVRGYLQECRIEDEQQRKEWIQRVFDIVLAKELIH